MLVNGSRNTFTHPQHTLYANTCLASSRFPKSKMAAEQKISAALESELDSVDKQCIRPLQVHGLINEYCTAQNE